MVGLVLSALSFLLGYLGSRRSVGLGMASLLVFGFFYGVVRARFLDGFTHFIYDAGALGIYLGHFSRIGGFKAPQSAPDFQQWVYLLMGWPIVVFGLGIIYPQHFLIQLVGLRAAVWFLPFLFLGAWAKTADLVLISRTLAILVPITLLFGLAEYVLGLQLFFPLNSVTKNMYESKDVANYTAYRIPATFSSSAMYGSVMVICLPFLLGQWLTPKSRLPEKLLMLNGVLCAVFGIFLCGSRTPVVLLFALGGVVAYQLRGRIGYILVGLLGVGVLTYLVASDARLQRFTTLQDNAMVAERFGQSTNVGVLKLFLEYPIGAGLGSAFGTSIPGFLSHLAPEPIGTENEFARIGVEQTVVGLFLWVMFLIWLGYRRRGPMPGGWEQGRELMLASVILNWGTGLISPGLLTAIPLSGLLLFLMGVLGRTYPTHTIPPKGVPSQTRSRAVNQAVVVKKGLRRSPLRTSS